MLLLIDAGNTRIKWALLAPDAPLGGWLAKAAGAQALFAASGGLMLLWLLVAWPMKAPGRDAGSAVPDPAGAPTAQPVKL